MDGGSQCAGSFSVDDTHLLKTLFMASLQVIRNQIFDVPGPERVQIEDAGDGEFDGFVHVRPARMANHPGAVSCVQYSKKDLESGEMHTGTRWESSLPDGGYSSRRGRFDQDFTEHRPRPEFCEGL